MSPSKTGQSSSAVNRPIFRLGYGCRGQSGLDIFLEADVLPREGEREAWPDLSYEAWRDTCATLQLWTQIVGKIRLSQTPWLNHSWHVTLYVTARGLTTSPIPFAERVFQIDFDFIDHLLRVETSNGAQRQIPLRAQPVADFYTAIMATLADLGMRVKIGEWQTRFASARTERTPLTIPNMRAVSGRFSCRPIACSSSSGLASSASAAPCISSGAVSILR
jgi:hypothetical protein